MNEHSILREQQIAALEASIDGLAVLDSKERYVYLNEAHAKIYGFESPNDLIGKNWKALYDGAELERFERNIMPTLFRDGYWRGESLGKRKDGSHFPQEVSLNIVRGGGLICVVRDITKRKKAEEKRSIISEIIRSFADSIDYSDTIERISAIAVPRFADFCILHLQATGRFGEQKRVVGARGDQEKILEQLVISDSSELQLPAELDVASWIFAPLRVRGTTIGSLTFLRSSRHPQGRFAQLENDSATEIASRAALAIENSRLFVEAREAVQLQENLMTAVSHDLKNPLLALGINVEILNRIAKSTPFETQLRGVAHNIKVSVDQMSCLVEQLLEFSRLRSGRMTLQKRTHPVMELFSAITAMFGPVSEKKSVSMQIKVYDSVNVLCCDGERIIRVLSNIVSNAIKFTSPGGRITIEAFATELAVHFKVSDTGVGIAPEDLPRVFDRYWTSSQSASQGTGLGLTIAKGIVEAHGGKIWAESSPGSGSTFSFSIPTR